MSTNYEFQKRKLYNYLGKGLVETFKNGNVIIAGGCINSIFTNKDINDIDVYFRSDDDLVDVVADVYDSNWILAHTKKATLFKKGEKLVQLIHFKRFKNAQEIFDTFDFTVCMGAFDFKTEEFILHDDFLLDNIQGILNFNSNTDYPIMSMLRVDKYKNKGYNISKSEFIRVLLTCMNLEINTIEELKEQLGGMYGLDFSKILKDVEIKEDGQVDLVEVVNKLKDLYLEEDYFKGISEDEKIEFDDVDDLIESILGKPIKYIKINENKYKINAYKHLDDLHEKKDREYEEVSAEEYFKDKKFYKFVDSKDGKLISCYKWNRQEFEYKLNEEIMATIGDKQIYCNYNDSIECSSYYSKDNENRKLLELEVEYKDIVSVDDNTITFKKVKPVRIVEKEEWIKWVDIDTEDNDPFRN
jgi:hypothetical protein